MWDEKNQKSNDDVKGTTSEILQPYVYIVYPPICQHHAIAFLERSTHMVKFPFKDSFVTSVENLYPPLLSLLHSQNLFNLKALLREYHYISSSRI